MNTLGDTLVDDNLLLIRRSSLTESIGWIIVLVLISAALAAVFWRGWGVDSTKEFPNGLFMEHRDRILILEDHGDVSRIGLHPESRPEGNDEIISPPPYPIESSIYEHSDLTDAGVSLSVVTAHYGDPVALVTSYESKTGRQLVIIVELSQPSEARARAHE